MTFDKFLLKFVEGLVDLPKSLFIGGWQRDYDVARVGSEERRAVTR